MIDRTFFVAAAFALATGCTTAAGTTVDPDGGPSTTDSDRNEAGPTADAAATCATAPEVVVANGTVTDAIQGFQFAVPAGFTSRREACEDIPSLFQVTPDPNRPPRRIAISGSKGAYNPADKPASTSPTGVKYYLLAGIGQESGKVSEWHLIISSTDWGLQFTTDAESKAALEEIAASFRWTR
jgi:hypothetical protein